MKSRVFTVALVPVICMVTISMASTPTAEATNAISLAPSAEVQLAGNCSNCGPKRVGPIRRFERWKWSKIRGLVRRGSC